MTKATESTMVRRARLEEQRRELKGNLKKVEEEIKEADEQLLDELAEIGVDSVRVPPYTFYVKRELWASAEDHTKTVKALYSYGMEDYVTPERVNTQTISSYVRELERDTLRELQEQGIDQGPSLTLLQSTLPIGLRESLKLAELFKVGVRRAQ